MPHELLSDGGVELLSSHVVYNTAYAGDVCRLLEGELPGSVTYFKSTT